MASPISKRGPRVGDSSSLWNFTLVPGWSNEEVATLKLALMKFGVGMWKEIVESGCLPGKLIQQLNGQTQRLLGQQSLAAFTRLRIDVDKVRAFNLLKTDVKRKNGLIINEGGVLSKDERERQREENEKNYGVDQATIESIELEVAGARQASTALGACPDRPHSMRTKALNKQLDGAARATEADKVVAALTGLNALEVDLITLSWQAKVALLLHLRREVVSVYAAHGPAPAPAAADEAMAIVPSDENLPPVANGKKRAGSVSKEEAARKPKAAKSGVKGGAKMGAKPPPKGRKGAKAAVSEDEDEEANDTSSLAKLMAMGFSKRKGQDALDEAHGSLEIAVEALFS